MKEVKKFITEDGQEFSTKKRAKQHEIELELKKYNLTYDEIQNMMNKLKECNYKLGMLLKHFTNEEFLIKRPDLIKAIVIEYEKIGKIHVKLNIYNKEEDLGYKIESEAEQIIKDIKEKYKNDTYSEKKNNNTLEIIIKEKELTLIEKLNKNIKLSESEIRDFKDENQIIYEEFGDDRRWTRSVLTVIEDENNEKWAIEWEQGLTECQENEFFDQPYKVKLETIEKQIIVTETKVIKL